MLVMRHIWSAMGCGHMPPGEAGGDGGEGGGEGGVGGGAEVVPIKGVHAATNSLALIVIGHDSIQPPCPLVRGGSHRGPPPLPSLKHSAPQAMLLHADASPTVQLVT